MSKSELRRLNIQLEAALKFKDEHWSAMEDKIAQLEAELDKWRNWKPDSEDLADMQEQAQCRDGSYNSGLAACGVYIGGLEYRVRELEAKNQRLREFCLMLRETIAAGRVVTFQDVDIEFLDALKEGE